MSLHLPGNMAGDVPDCLAFCFGWLVWFYFCLFVVLPVCLLGTGSVGLVLGLVWFFFIPWWLLEKWLVLQVDAQYFGPGSALNASPAPSI